VEDACAQVLERRGGGSLGERRFRIGLGRGLEILLAGGENQENGDCERTTMATHGEAVLTVNATVGMPVMGKLDQPRQVDVKRRLKSRETCDCSL
jgi:hypothetical protein